MTGLTIGLEYSVTVTATNSYSEGEKSKPVSGRFLAVPSQPLALYEEVDMRTADSLVLVWKQPEDLGGAVELTYNVYM